MGYRRKVLEGRRIEKRRKFLIKTEDYRAASRQCLKKSAYPSEKKIIAKINEIAEMGRRSLRYYQCPFCNLWHISHKIKDGQKFVS